MNVLQRGKNGGKTVKCNSVYSLEKERERRAVAPTMASLDALTSFPSDEPKPNSLLALLCVPWFWSTHIWRYSLAQVTRQDNGTATSE